MWFNSGNSGVEVKFTFAAPRLITEAKWYQSAIAAHGDWQWQGSPDNSAWTNIGSTFTLGTAATQTITTLSGNATAYRYYRMLQTTGTASTSPYLYEIEFSIDSGVANTTWNPSDKTANITLTGSNLIATSTSVSRGIVRAADCQVAGKFYFEYTCNVIAGANTSLGIATSLMTSAGALSDLNACQINKTSGQVWANGVNAFTFGTSLANGNVVCIALDCTARLIWFRIGAAGNWNNNATYNPATGVGGVAIFNFGAALQAFPFAGLQATSDQITANFGDTAFVGAVPSGYTSGFTAGASVPTNALASQAVAEHWLTTSPQAQVTQVVAEHWASVASGNLQAVVTQVMLEHWASVAVVVPAAGGPMVTMIH
jgi:hypothetical protein